MNRKGMVFAGMGFELLGLVVAGLYMGRAIDQEMGWPGYALAGLVMVALLGWCFHIYWLLERFERDEE